MMERSLYYWARSYSSALTEGMTYSQLPRTVVISIIAFNLFDCEEFHSEYQSLEVKRKTPLTDKMLLHYFELPKIPDIVTADDELNLWLTLFNAKTEEDLARIEEMEVPVMEKAINAYRKVTATDEFKELERLRSRAHHNEMSALAHARQEAEKAEHEKWQSVVEEKDAEIARLRAQLEQ